MFSTIYNYLAKQARKPTGLFGRIVAPAVFNRENREMEQYGLEFLDPGGEEHILEIGPGNGRLISEILTRLEGGKVCGIDISEEMVNLVSRRYARWIEEGSLEVSKASISDIPYPKAFFEKAVTCNTIYFWPNPVKDLQEVLRVLKPGGKFWCGMRTRQQMEAYNAVVQDNRHVFENLYSMEEAMALMEDAGFVEVVSHRKEGDGPEDVHVLSGSKKKA